MIALNENHPQEDSDEDFDDAYEEPEETYPTLETYRKLNNAIDLGDLAQIKDLLGNEDAEATSEIQDKILALSRANFEAIRPVFKLLDEYWKISDSLLRR